MNGKEIFKIWSPSKSLWSAWVRPVPFISINENLKIHEVVEFIPPQIYYLDEYEKDTAIFVDLPNYESVEVGISLAKIGYQPIPIYNGTIEEENVLSTTDNRIILPALILGAQELKKISIKNNNNPVFLLDSERMNRHKADYSTFDNSWDIYDQDVPTGNFLMSHGIKKIILHSDILNKDLKKIFYKYQQKGIEIYFTKGYEKPKKVIIKKPTKRELNSI